MKWTLYPLGLIYIFISFLKRKLYENGIFTQKKLPRKTWSIGNLTMGGSGKTPFTLFLAQKLIEKGKKPAIILRGYGRKTKGPILVTIDKPAEEVGEEALVYKSNFDADVVVSEKREEAVELLQSLPDLFLLDDGFQHQRLKRDFDILVLDASMARDLRPLPFGRLREPLSSAKKAGLIVVTKGKFDQLPRELLFYIKDKPFVEAAFLWEENFLPGNIQLNALLNKRPFMLLGIGNPASFKKTAIEKGFNPVGEKLLRDHAFPNDKLVSEINSLTEKSRADFILTSEKDYMKWSGRKDLRLGLVYPKLTPALDDPEGRIEELLSNA